MARIQVIDGQADPGSVSLDAVPRDRELVLGRAHECDVRILDESASRKHAVIRRHQGRWIVVDLDSANGTLLNGEPVTGNATLLDGDVLIVGAVRIKYIASDLAQRVTAVHPKDHDDADDLPVAATLSADAVDPAIHATEGKNAERLGLVMDGAIACADARDATELAQSMTTLIHDRLGSDRVTLATTDARGELGVVASVPVGAPVPESKTLKSRVLQGGETVLIQDAHVALAQGTSDATSSASILASRYRTVVAAPLHVSEGTLGLLCVEYLDPHLMNADDLHVVATLAQQAALALRTLRLVASLRTHSSRAPSSLDSQKTVLLGTSSAMDHVRHDLTKAAKADASVLVTGETGTGKELAARMIHEQSARAAAPFVAINCAALVEGLVESEFFGHEKGAFTGASSAHDGRIAQAGSGTLFLDEVGELPPSMQAKLLRVLSERTFRRVGGSKLLPMKCRVISATNRALPKEVEARHFREDLYYRLAVVIISLPPLRAREGDVALLAETALAKTCAALGRRVPRLARDASECLASYEWPGNVRELFNVIERAVVLLDGDTIGVDDLPLEIRLGSQPSNIPSSDVLTLREAERRAVEAALRHTRGKKGEAAKLLGTSWPTLNRKIREYGIDVTRGD